MGQTAGVRRRATAVLLALMVFVGACADAPDPGDLAAFCDLLAADVGLSTQATEAEYAQLALVAPPEIRPTIDSLQTQARDFDELLNVQPPDLAAIFTAKFDPAAESDRAELDRYAESGCNLLIARPPSVRWANFVRENHADAAWRDAVAMDFISDGTQGVTAAAATFAEAPAPMGLVEDVCDALSDFLSSDGSGAASIQVFIGTVVVINESSPDGPCRLP